MEHFFALIGAVLSGALIGTGISIGLTRFMDWVTTKNKKRS